MDELVDRCPSPGCGEALLPIAPTQVAPDIERDPKPDSVRCVNGHEHPVLKRERDASGHPRYVLGPMRD